MDLSAATVLISRAATDREWRSAGLPLVAAVGSGSEDMSPLDAEIAKLVVGSSATWELAALLCRDWKAWPMCGHS